MTIKKIYQYQDPVLRNETQPVTAFDKNLAALAADMAETMYDAPGIGLARETAKEYMTLVNPEITAHEGNQIDEEGCLSVPDLTAKVKRYKQITVTYQDLSGETKQLSVDNRFAVVLQHEIDHLNGILFIDHLSPLKRSLYKKKVKKWLANQQE